MPLIPAMGRTQRTSPGWPPGCDPGIAQTDYNCREGCSGHVSAGTFIGKSLRTEFRIKLQERLVKGPKMFYCHT